MMQAFLTSPWLRAEGAPVAAAAVALAMVGARRLGRAAADFAIGAGVLAGWVLLAGSPLGRAGVVHALPGLGAMAAALAATAGRPAWVALAATVALGGLAGWWVAGAPDTVAGADAAAAAMLAGAVLAALYRRTLRTPVQAVTAAAVLAGALVAAGAPPAWLLAAAVLAAAALAALGGASTVALPVAMAGLAVAADLALGRMRAGINAADAACLAPVVALWLLPRVQAVRRRLPPAAAALGVGLAVTAVVAAIRHIRHG